MAWYFYKNYILDCFHQKKQNNPHYSLRAFARDLKIAHSTISGILQHKQLLSFKLAKQISSKMELNKNLQYLFFHSIAKEKIDLGNQKIEKEFMEEA